MRRIVLAGVLSLCCLTVAFAADQWSQFRGPDRANRSPETGLLTSWPEDGPKLLWTARGMGEGYSTVSVSDGTVFTMGNYDGQEQLVAVDEKSGELTERGRQIFCSVPMARFGEVREVADAALWLLSDRASFVTGAVIPVDGGYTAFSGV